MSGRTPQYVTIMAVGLALSFAVTVVVTVTGIISMPVLPNDELRMI